MAGPVSLNTESDIFIGTRRRVNRYLVCTNNGYFPVLAKTGADSLAVIYRVDAPHVGINGTLAVSTSADGGKTWSSMVRITPGGEDPRNPAFGVNKAGDLIAAFWKAGLQSYVPDERGNMTYATDPAYELPDVDAMFYCKSSDNGCTWSEPVLYHSGYLKLASPYGRIITAPNGELIMSVYGAPRGEEHAAGTNLCILVRSKDDGLTWGDETPVAYGYNEASYLFLPDGTMLCAARNMAGSVSILESKDTGRTWSEPIEVTRVGEHPADLTLLDSGRVMLTFGRRIRPMGCGLLFSDDQGKTWNKDKEVLLAGDGVRNGDLGYPSTIQLEDGHLVTVLYYASGSEPTGEYWGWGDISLQAITYTEADVTA